MGTMVIGSHHKALFPQSKCAITQAACKGHGALPVGTTAPYIHLAIGPIAPKLCP
jgi:hypothetical protein